MNGIGAVVAGASRGIGREVAARLVEAGARVVMVARGEEALCHAAERVGGQPIAADVSRPEDADRVARAARALLDGPPEVLVNSTGGFVLAPVAETAPAAFGDMLAGNLWAPFLMIRALLPDMLDRGSGHIVTLGSVAGRVPLPHNGAYGASKFGLRGLHEVLSLETRGTGVRTTLVEPAATDTALWDAVDFAATPGLPPRDSMLSPEEVAEAVLWALTRPPRVDVSLLAVEGARGS